MCRRGKATLRYRVLFPIKRLDNKTRFPLVSTRYAVFDTSPSPRWLRPPKTPVPPMSSSGLTRGSLIITQFKLDVDFLDIKFICSPSYHNWKSQIVTSNFQTQFHLIETEISPGFVKGENFAP